MVKEKRKSLLVHHKRNSSSVDSGSSANKVEVVRGAPQGGMRGNGKARKARDRKWK